MSVVIATGKNMAFQGGFRPEAVVEAAPTEGSFVRRAVIGVGCS